MHTGSIGHIPHSGRILHFDIVDHIGSGPHGTVYRAWDIGSEIMVALKIIPPSRMHATWIQQYRTSIAPLLQTIRHPYLAELHTVEEWEGHLVVAGEYVDSVPVRPTLLDGTGMDESRLLELAAQALAGLAALHAHGLAHGGLHAGNMLLRSDGCLKICDAGWGTGPGALSYQHALPIEDAEANVPLDLRALGRWLYGLITEKSLATHAAPVDAASLSSFGISGHASLVIAKLLTDKPEDLFPSATAALVSVEAISSFERDYVEPERERVFLDATPRQYLTLSFLMLVLVFFWWALAGG